MSSAALPDPKVRPGRKLLRWLPTFLWLCLQAAFSTDTFSAEHTGSILWAITHAIFPGMSASQFAAFHFFVRKSAHFVTYGLLSVFAYYSWRATLPAPARWALRWSVLALAVVLAAGSLDEFHQSFVPSRTASPRDVLLDTTGAIFFQMLIILWNRRRKRTRSSADELSA